MVRKVIAVALFVLAGAEELPSRDPACAISVVSELRTQTA
jgi:hypothetical protein